jgi:integrase
MSDKQIEKEVNRQAVLFEESCKKWQSATAAKFETFARMWFRDYAELKLKRLTVSKYHALEKRTYAALGHIRVDRITPLDVQRFISSLVAGGLSTNSVKDYGHSMSVILNYAVKKRILNFNPCLTVDYPAPNQKERVFFTIEEIKEFLGLLREEPDDKKPYAVFFMLAAYMGARKGELLGLEWKDIDFDNNVITINRAYYYSPHEKASFTDTPKTAASRRSLKMPAHVMGALGEYRKWQSCRRETCGGSWQASDRLFTAWNGAPMHPSTPYRYLVAFCERAGMRKVTVHSFRHFNASALINSGVDVVTVQAALGHSTPATTLSVYSHTFDNAKTRAMEAISNAIDL